MRFSAANAKIEALSAVPELSAFLIGDRTVYSFDLLSGWACPMAMDCKSKAVADANGKRHIEDGPDTKWRCFSASQEVQYTNTYMLRHGNWQSLRAMTEDEMVEAILAAMPDDAGIVRVHVGGDFFNAAYFRAWLRVAELRPDVLVYAYTKSLPYWVANRERVDACPNLVLTASRGGRCDHMIDEYGLRSVKVCFSEADAGDLAIDHDDSHAACPSLRHDDFALLIHGTQPKGSEAADALKALKAAGVKHSYSRS